MSGLPQKRERMKKIFRGEQSYGDGTAVEQATLFRLTEMYDDVVAAAKANSADVAIPQVDLLVSLSGFTPETTLIMFELVQPRELLVISSENAEHRYAIIDEKLRGKLPPWKIRLHRCDPADPSDIYEIVKREVRRQPGEAPLTTIIDITGGKKVMSAGAALAASQLDLKMCYVDGEFDPETRQAVPGTERITILANPTELFGDQDMAAATGLLRSGSYAAAHDRFGDLSKSISEPARARFLSELAELYQAWCDLDLDTLARLVYAVRSRLDDPRSAVAPTTARRLVDQLAFVERLVAKDPSALLLNFFLLGEHYLGMGRYDFAALLFYRTIEQSFSERMARAYGGFDFEHPDYALLTPDRDEFQASYLAVTRLAFPAARPNAALPWKVGLVDAMLLLHVLHDPMLPAARIKDVKGVQHVVNLVEARNRSVLAHGVESVTSEQCGGLRERARCNLRAFWKLHHGNENVDERVSMLRFVDEV